MSHKRGYSFYRTSKAHFSHAAEYSMPICVFWWLWRRMLSFRKWFSFWERICTVRPLVFAIPGFAHYQNPSLFIVAWLATYFFVNLTHVGTFAKIKCSQISRVFTVFVQHVACITHFLFANCSIPWGNLCKWVNLARLGNLFTFCVSV